jgi:Carboxypeptidase regulatory-like domain
MRWALLLFLCAATQAGVVRGVVLEHASGLPLARARVRLDPIPAPGSDLKPLQTRAEHSGHFVFIDVPSGSYILTALRDPYFPAAYGQRRPEGQGTPIVVTDESDLFADLRMFRQGAITGRVLDENGIGLSDVAVIAYRARLPLISAGRAVSDDRGVYRIHGLDPGNYWVRTVASTLDDGTGLLPTWGPETLETREAHLHRAVLDTDTIDADLRPLAGRLFHLRGNVQCEPLPSDTPPAQTKIVVTLSSETGRKSVEGACNGTYSFEGLAPASYEVLATRGNGDAGFFELSLDHDIENGNVQLLEPAAISIDVRRPGSSGVANIPVTVVGKRQDLGETEPEQEIKPRTRLAPGHWELTARVGPGQYVESISTFGAIRRETVNGVQPPDWFTIFIAARGSTRITVVVSDQAAQLDANVMQDAKAVPGAPVFLWPVDDSVRRSLHGYRIALADVNGRAHFDGLPPGDYRVFSSFDSGEIDEEIIEQANAQSIRIEPTRAMSVDLPLWLAP